MPPRCSGGCSRAGEAVDLVVSRAARLTLLDETGARVPGRALAGGPAHLAALGADGKRAVRRWSRRPSGVRLLGGAGISRPARSGSYPVKGMLIVPASTACVAGVALGLSKDLLQRAASVTLKERRPWWSRSARPR